MGESQKGGFMPEEETGEETKVDDTTGTDAADQGKDDSRNTDDGGGEKRIEVTADVLRAFRDEIKNLKDQTSLYKTQLEFAAQNSRPATNPQNVATGVQSNATTDKDTGEIKFDLDDDDVVTGAELKRIVKSLGNRASIAASGDGTVNIELQRRLAMIELSQEDSKWQETIKTYLPKIVNENPEIANMIRGSANPLKAALYFAKTNPEYKKAGKGDGDSTSGGDDLMSQIDKMIENSEKPTGGKHTTTAAATGSDKFLNMSDEDFDAHVHKVLSG